jgi:hypothetical protein
VEVANTIHNFYMSEGVWISDDGNKHVDRQA